jgi:hypothetical protein
MTDRTAHACPAAGPTRNRRTAIHSNNAKKLQPTIVNGAAGGGRRVLVLPAAMLPARRASIAEAIGFQMPAPQLLTDKSVAGAGPARARQRRHPGRPNWKTTSRQVFAPHQENYCSAAKTYERLP